MPAEKPKITFTPVQQSSQWQKRVQLEVRERGAAPFRQLPIRARSLIADFCPFGRMLLERVQSHHESALPSQRYRVTRQLPINLNPIVPQDVSAHMTEGSGAQ